MYFVSARLTGLFELSKAIISSLIDHGRFSLANSGEVFVSGFMCHVYVQFVGLLMTHNC